jgi:hypothetical protein
MGIFDFRPFFDVKNPKSFANKMRTRRFLHFEKLVENLPRPIRLLDVGGTYDYWVQRGWVGREDVQITIVNLGVQERVIENVDIRDGSALDLSGYPDGSFDVVYSNSVIEHLFTLDNQRRMVKEILRVACSYWVQTPNYWFPIEPHFHVLGWQWLPRSIRTALLMKYRCGWRGPVQSREDAEILVDEVRLLSARELQSLLPEGYLWRERIFGVTKSLVAYGGFGMKLP